MEKTELGKMHLSKKRFTVERIKLRKWEQESEYKWQVVDKLGVVKPVKTLLCKDAEIVASRLQAQHKNEVKSVRKNQMRMDRE